MSRESLCISCWGTIQPPQDRLSIKNTKSNKLDYYHANYQDCSDAIRSGMIKHDEEGELV